MTGQKRGKCPVCGYSFRLRKDGTVQTHRLYSGHAFHHYCPPGRNPREPRS